MDEGLRTTPKAIVINIYPDVCLTPVGSLMVPVPYRIVATLDDSVKASSNVMIGKHFVFTVASRVSRVTGNEAGVGGGVFSGVNLGWCRPITFFSSVTCNGEYITMHDARFHMNCAGPEGTPNTVGKALYLHFDSIEDMQEDNEALEDGFPYDDETLEEISSMREYIKEYSKKYNVPEVAVAGSIADELNTYSWIDSLQDWWISGRSDNTFSKHMEKPGGTKLFNTFQNDLGPGNIKLDTAWSLYEKYPDHFPDSVSSPKSMVSYIQSHEGTAHVAAMYIAEAKGTYGAALSALPEHLQEAVLVTAYKRGIEHYDLVEKLQTTDPFRPGEGLRVAAQRERILGYLNPEEDSSGICIMGSSCKADDEENDSTTRQPPNNKENPRRLQEKTIPQS
ncbi:MAG: DUF4150 domain-containing protein [Myxococcota bacterium]